MQQLQYPDFESDVVKIIGKAHDTLTKDEEFACRQLLLKEDVEGSLAVITSTGDFAREKTEETAANESDRQIHRLHVYWTYL